MDRVRPYLAPALFVAPGMLLYAAFILYPMAQAVVMSFFDWKVVAGATSTFLGFGNYARALTDLRNWLSLTNSGVYMLFTVPPQIALGLAIALLLRERVRRSRCSALSITCPSSPAGSSSRCCSAISSPTRASSTGCSAFRSAG